MDNLYTQEDLRQAFIAGYKSGIDSANRMFYQHRRIPLTDIRLEIKEGEVNIKFEIWSKRRETTD